MRGVEFCGSGDVIPAMSLEEWPPPLWEGLKTS